MSDMIDRLSALSREAGNNAGASLNARSSLDSMEERIQRGVRRRRRNITGVSAVTVLLAGAGATLAPQLLDDIEPPALPGTEVEIVGTTGAVTVMSDGSMSLVTANGDIVDIPPVEPDDYVPFVGPSTKDMCLGPNLDHFPLGWEYHQDSAKDIVTFGRPQLLLLTGPRLLAQGSTYVAEASNDHPPLAFQLEADPAIAPHVMLRAVEWSVGERGTAWYSTRLDATPDFVVEGGDSGARPAAVIQSRPLPDTGYCYPAAKDYLIESHYLRYVEVDVFISDHLGSSVLIATHRSWSALDMSQVDVETRISK